MPYLIKEIFYSLQGEGINTGRPAIFCRFSGCNLWNGIQSDRDKSTCSFCDTDFIGTNGTFGGQYSTPAELIDRFQKIAETCEKPGVFPMIVFTGGEPLLQVDAVLIGEVRKAGFFLAIETNGTIKLPFSADWLTVSPKSGTLLKQTTGDELKLIFPQKNIVPSDFLKLDFKHFCLQPLDCTHLKENINRCIEFCLKNPIWRLSLQTHKLLNIR
ncbi:MAG: 7-carboxy-7-deazaguanine synthase [Candidatus Riflebacteria bacterium]|nr:7-carboxy-7-deazaguanine synthase [Candidatus Riflebacteria bacterium]